MGFGLFAPGYDALTTHVLAKWELGSLEIKLPFPLRFVDFPSHVLSVENFKPKRWIINWIGLAPGKLE